MTRPPSLPQPHSSREPLVSRLRGAQRHLLRATCTRLRPSWAARPKQPRRGQGFGCPQAPTEGECAGRVCTAASEGALGWHFSSLSSPRDDRGGTHITGFLAGPAYLAGEQRMGASVWASAPEGTATGCGGQHTARSRGCYQFVPRGWKGASPVSLSPAQGAAS